jgi:hypothetical protein
MTPHDLAKELVGNWRKFESFGWSSAPDDARNWCIVYTEARDSDLVDQSNASVVEAALEPFWDDDSDVQRERHRHWACGWIDGWAIRVYDQDGSLTPAFEAYAALHCALQDYPLLDEDDFSRREYEAAIDAIENEAPDFRPDKPAPDGWAAEVFGWLWENNQAAVENADGHGASPSRDDITEAFDALGIEYEKDDES